MLTACCWKRLGLEGKLQGVISALARMRAASRASVCPPSCPVLCLAPSSVLTWVQTRVHGREAVVRGRNFRQVLAHQYGSAPLPRRVRAAGAGVAKRITRHARAHTRHGQPHSVGWMQPGRTDTQHTRAHLHGTAVARPGESAPVTDGTVPATVALANAAASSTRNMHSWTSWA